MGDAALALLSHSLKDDEAEKLAVRYGCGSWTGMDSSLKFCLIAEARFDADSEDGEGGRHHAGAGAEAYSFQYMIAVAVQT